MNSALPLSAERRKKLEYLFFKWRTQPSRPIELAVAIDRACAYSELHYQEESTELTAGEQRQEVNRYRDTINKAKKLAQAMPGDTAAAMQSNAMAFQDPEGKLTSELCRQLALVDPGALLGLLESLADTYIEHHLPKRGERQRFNLWLVQEIAIECKAHGITASTSDRGHFHQVIEIIFPHVSDHRDLIRQALNGGKSKKKS